MKERTFEEQLDTRGENAAVCPYCGYCDENAHENMNDTTGDGDHEDVDCPECGQEYRLTFNFTFAYTTERMEEVSK